MNIPQDELRVLGEKMSAERKTAINRRKQQGLDEIWEKARKQYAGVDELNGPSRPEGPTHIDGPVTLTGFKHCEEDRSTVFDNITRSYTETGFSKVSDILLPTGKMPWDLENTPVTEQALIFDALGAFPELASTIPPAMLEPTTDESVVAAKKYISDYLSECDWLGEIRVLIKEAAITGTGVLKGPVPTLRKLSAKYEALLAMFPPDSPIHYQLKYSPISETIPVENCYPDPLCGNNIQNGAFFWEKIPEVSKRQLDDWAKQDEYLPDQIAKVVRDGPKSATGENKTKDSPFEVWIRTGRVKIDGESKFRVLEMCNEEVIKVQDYPLDNEKFPYDILCWEDRDNSWTGIGIPERIETPQRGLNSSLRAIHDNMKWSVGFQFVYRDGKIEPIKSTSWTPEPYKAWRETASAFGNEDSTPPIYTIEFPNHTPALMPVVEYWIKRAEHVANLPLVLQGQATTDSVGVTQTMMNNATTNLRSIVKACDSKIFIPHIERYYEWTQLYGPEGAKGDAKVTALGSSVLITKELQQQILTQLLDRSLIRQFKLSPTRIMQAMLEGNQLEYSKLALTEEEDAALAEAESQPEYQVQVAQIEAEWRKYDSDMDYDMAIKKLQLEAAEKDLDYKQAIDVETIKAKTAVATTPPVKSVPNPEPGMPPAEEPNIDTEAALEVLGFGGV